VRDTAECCAADVWLVDELVVVTGEGDLSQALNGAFDVSDGGVELCSPGRFPNGREIYTDVLGHEVPLPERMRNPSYQSPVRVTFRDQ
jgi:hypothetical protein